MPPRYVAVWPLSFFVLHATAHVWGRTGGEILWVCTTSNALLALGIWGPWPLLIRLATLWLLLGLPLWLLDIALHGLSAVTTLLTHLGSLSVGLYRLQQARFARHTWLFAVAWMVLLQGLSRLFTAPALNVNVAHRIYDGWTIWVQSYWQFWLITTILAACLLWCTEAILLKWFPPNPSGAEVNHADNSCR